MSAADGGSARALDEGEARALLAAPRSKPAPWSDAEDAVLRGNYCKRGPRWCAALLPGRSLGGVRCRARALDLRTSARWTDDERSILRREWGELSWKTMRGMLPGRSWGAVASQAARMGLGDPAQGMHSIEAVVARTGLSRGYLLRVLAVEGVQVIRRPLTSPKKRRRGRPKAGTRGRSRSGYRWLAVDMDRAVEAVESWMARRASRMTCLEAADHCGLDKTTMRWALTALAATRPVEGLAPGRAWSVTAADAEAAVALYRVRQAEAQAARPPRVRGARGRFVRPSSEAPPC